MLRRAIDAAWRHPTRGTLTVSGVAEMLKVDRTTVHRWFKGKRQIQALLLVEYGPLHPTDSAPTVGECYNRILGTVVGGEDKRTIIIKRDVP